MVAIAAFVVVIAGMRAATTIVVPFLLAAFIAIISAPPHVLDSSKRFAGVVFSVDRHRCGCVDRIVNLRPGRLIGKGLYQRASGIRSKA